MATRYRVECEKNRVSREKNHFLFYFRKLGFLSLGGDFSCDATAGDFLELIDVGLSPRRSQVSIDYFDGFEIDTGVSIYGLKSSCGFHLGFVYQGFEINLEMDAAEERKETKRHKEVNNQIERLEAEVKALNQEVDNLTGQVYNLSV
ncbi:hypothetical protein F2Q68_00002913 [Brassica cretica]|nr:hypothetical protein F2Q68_00002913 [Brassica cretica]